MDPGTVDHRDPRHVSGSIDVNLGQNDHLRT